MTHDEAYVMWRLGRAIERADMTTRVLGVRAADVLSQTQREADDHDEVQWMGVLKSVWGLQMYQRAVRGPIEGSSVVRFLLEHDRFPRAVRALLREIRLALGRAAGPGRSARRRRPRRGRAARLDGGQHRRRRRSTTRWTTCSSPSPSSTAGSSIATCRSAHDVAAPRAGCGPVTSAEELLPRFLTDHLALTRRQAEADRLIGASLAGHLVHELPGADGEDATRDRPWRLDPIPFVLDGDVFDVLAAAVVQRVEAMEALLADLYGPRQAVRAGVVPAEALSSSPRYRLAAVGAPPPPRWVTTYAVDVIQLADGSWRVVQDLADTPTGVGYALIDRAVMARVAAELLGPEGSTDLASISGFPSEVRRALAALHDRRQPADRRVQRRARRTGLRRALVAGPAARLQPRRGRRPRRAQGSGLAAHARRARPDRRRLPTAGRYRRRSDRGEHDQHVRRAGAAVRGHRGRRGAGQRPRLGRARGPVAGRLVASRRGGPDGHPPRARAARRRRGAGERAGVPRRPDRAPPRSSCACTPSPAPTASP